MWVHHKILELQQAWLALVSSSSSVRIEFWALSAERWAVGWEKPKIRYSSGPDLWVVSYLSYSSNLTLTVLTLTWPWPRPGPGPELDNSLTVRSFNFQKGDGSGKYFWREQRMWHGNILSASSQPGWVFWNRQQITKTSETKARKLVYSQPYLLCSLD